MTDPASDSVLAQLRTSPRLWWFMSILSFSAVGIGLTTVGRLQYATDAFGNELGIGTVGVAAALVGAAVAIPVGILVDVRDARRVAVVMLAAVVAVFALEAVAASRPGALPLTAIVLLSLAQGAAAAGWLTALAKVQASLVPPGSRGAAEIINVLRMGVGASIGVVLAVRIGVPAVSLGLSAVMGSTAFLALLFFASPVSPLSGGRAGTSLLVMARTVNGLPLLRAAVVTDLVLWLVIPTQLVATMIVDQAAPEVASAALGAGFAGVVVGRLLLVRHGVGGNLPRRLGLPLVAWVLSLVGGWLSLRDGWVLDRPAFVAALVGVGSALTAYVQGLTGALVQQRSPDDIRGRLTGVVGAARFLLTALGVLLLTAIIGLGDSQAGLVALASGALLTVAALRGFRSIVEPTAADAAPR